MAICITFGTHEFTSMLKDYENVRAYCYNCQHWNGHCLTRWPFFTICFIPVIPLAFHKYREVTCYTCRFTQDLRCVLTFTLPLSNLHPSEEGLEIELTLNSDRPDITPETRPPPGMASGRQPYFYPMQPQQAPQPPPEAHGAAQAPQNLAYK